MHDPTEAEDVVQETKVVLWEKFDEFEPGTNFPAWAAQVARYEALKARQKRSRDAKLFSDTFLEGLSREMERASDLLERRREALKQCLDKLPEPDRDLVRLRYEQEMSSRELAERNGRSERGTRKALHRVRTALMMCVERTLLAEVRR
jgi:RNA polymerase sigma-70 factor (ECF subfamily)